MSGIKSIIDLINKQNVLVLGSLVAKCLKIPNLRKSCWSVYLGIHILFLWIWGAWSRSLNIWAASKKTFTFARSWFAWFGRRYTSYYTAGILTNKPRQRVISDWTEGEKKERRETFLSSAQMLVMTFSGQKMTNYRKTLTASLCSYSEGRFVFLRSCSSFSKLGIKKHISIKVIVLMLV